MAHGLRIWDGAGGLILDTNTRITRVLGEVVIGGSPTGSFNDPSLAGGAVWWVVVGLPFSVNVRNKRPVISQSGTTLSWSWVGDYGIIAPPTSIIYGVY